MGVPGKCVHDLIWLGRGGGVYPSELWPGGKIANTQCCSSVRRCKHAG